MGRTERKEKEAYMMEEKTGNLSSLLKNGGPREGHPKRNTNQKTGITQKHEVRY
jgi:hypothetical protein